MGCIGTDMSQPVFMLRPLTSALTSRRSFQWRFIERPQPTLGSPDRAYFSARPERRKISPYADQAGAHFHGYKHPTELV